MRIETHTQVFTAALFEIAKIQKQPQRPVIDECIKCALSIQWKTTQP